MKAVRCGRFIDLGVASKDGDSKGEKRLAIFLYEGRAKGRIVYVAEFNSFFRGYVEYSGSALFYEIHGLEYWTENRMDICSDYCPYALYYYGWHGCDSVFTLGSYRRDCVHFIAPDRTSASDPESPKDRSKTIKSIRLLLKPMKETYNNLISVNFKLNIRFCKMETPNLREREKEIDYRIYRVKGSVLVVCPDRAVATCNGLNTMLALESDFSNLFTAYEGHGSASACLAIDWWLASTM